MHVCIKPNLRKNFWVPDGNQTRNLLIEASLSHFSIIINFLDWQLCEADEYEPSKISEHSICENSSIIFLNPVVQFAQYPYNI